MFDAYTEALSRLAETYCCVIDRCLLAFVAETFRTLKFNWANFDN